MKSTIKLTPVESSQLSAIGHDPASNTLAIRFPEKNGTSRVYHYSGVDAEFFDRFLHAESKGSFFIREIKSNTERFPYVRMDDVEAEPQQKEAA